MDRENFALGTWEIHLQTDNEQKMIIDKMQKVCKYIDTAIDYNNDYLLTNIPKSYTLISKISTYHLSEYDFFVSNHLKCLNRNSIDIMLIHSSRGNWKDLAVKMNNDKRFNSIGVSNFDINELKEYKQLIGNYPEYNEIEINPYYVDINTVSFCKENNIKIICYGIFGGKYNATKNIADFSIAYLLNFALHYADIAILKPECERHINEFVNVIENYDSKYDTYKYEPILKESKIDADNKSIVPMRYDPKSIIRYCYGINTYNNACGKNANKARIIEDIDTSKYPVFEMLGDYMTYMRYKYRKNYDKMPIYEYDHLIADDNTRYAITIFDNDKISKINLKTDNSNIKVVHYEKI